MAMLLIILLPASAALTASRLQQRSSMNAIVQHRRPVLTPLMAVTEEATIDEDLVSNSLEAYAQAIVTAQTAEVIAPVKPGTKQPAPKVKSEDLTHDSKDVGDGWDDVRGWVRNAKKEREKPLEEFKEKVVKPTVKVAKIAKALVSDIDSAPLPATPPRAPAAPKVVQPKKRPAKKRRRAAKTAAVPAGEGVSKSAGLVAAGVVAAGEVAATLSPLLDRAVARRAEEKQREEAAAAKADARKRAGAKDTAIAGVNLAMLGASTIALPATVLLSVIAPEKFASLQQQMSLQLPPKSKPASAPSTASSSTATSSTLATTAPTSLPTATKPFPSASGSAGPSFAVPPAARPAASVPQTLSSPAAPLAVDVELSVEVDVPMDAVAGDTLEIEAPGVRSFSYELPEGIKAGTAIQVLVPPRCIQRPGTGLAPADVPMLASLAAVVGLGGLLNKRDEAKEEAAEEDTKGALEAASETVRAEKTAAKQAAANAEAQGKAAASDAKPAAQGEASIDERFVRMSNGVRITLVTGQVAYYEGTPGEERMVRLEWQDGKTQYFEGVGGQERVVRTKLADGTVQETKPQGKLEGKPLAKPMPPSTPLAEPVATDYQAAEDASGLSEGAEAEAADDASGSSEGAEGQAGRDTTLDGEYRKKVAEERRAKRLSADEPATSLEEVEAYAALAEQAASLNIAIREKAGKQAAAGVPAAAAANGPKRGRKRALVAGAITLAVAAALRAAGFRMSVLLR